MRGLGNGSEPKLGHPLPILLQPFTVEERVDGHRMFSDSHRTQIRTKWKWKQIHVYLDTEMKVIFPNKTLTSWAVSRALSSALSLARVFWFVCFFQYFLLVCVELVYPHPSLTRLALNVKVTGQLCAASSLLLPSWLLEIYPRWSGLSRTFPCGTISLAPNKDIKIRPFPPKDYFMPSKTKGYTGFVPYRNNA